VSLLFALHVGVSSVADPLLIRMSLWFADPVTSGVGHAIADWSRDCSPRCPACAAADGGDCSRGNGAAGSWLTGDPTLCCRHLCLGLDVPTGCGKIAHACTPWLSICTKKTVALPRAGNTVLAFPAFGHVSPGDNWPNLTLQALTLLSSEGGQEDGASMLGYQYSPREEVHSAGIGVLA
jgi:hypothetical protein